MGLEEIAQNYFHKLFTASVLNDEELRNFGKIVPYKITLDANNILKIPVHEDYGVQALNQIHPLKACGKDGLPCLFLRKYWNITGSFVTKVCLGVLNENWDISKLNETVIFLILKVQKPTKMCEFRLINLYNVI